MALNELFNWALGSSETPELPEIYPLPIKEKEFVEYYIRSLYTKILVDTFERTQGIPEDAYQVLFDNCLGSETSMGLISFLAKAMTEKGELYLVYKKDLGTLREATAEEKTKIADAYKAGKETTDGVFISFKNNMRADLIKFYSCIEYSTTGGLFKQANLSRAIQFKMNKLRGSVGLPDRAIAEEQAKALATAFGKGRDGLMDSEDVIETAKPDLTAIDAALKMINAKMAMFFGVSASYFDGASKGGLSDTGDGDEKKNEQGFRNFYYSVAKPTSEALFNCKTKFKSYNFKNITAATEALTVFDLVSSRYISDDNKLLVINSLLGVDSKLGAEEKPTEVNTGGNPFPPKPGEKPPPPADKKAE